jgi:hypothetical protein
MLGRHPNSPIDGKSPMRHTAKAYFKPEHRTNPILLTAPDDIDHLLAALTAESWQNSVATIYIDGHVTRTGVPDHELQVVVDYADKTTGALRYTAHDGTYFTKGASTSGDSVVYFYMGNEVEYPRDSVVPIEDIRTAVKKFLETGERPMHRG